MGHRRVHAAALAGFTFLALAPAVAGAANPSSVRSCALNLTPPVVVAGTGDVQVFAIQYFQRVPAMASYASIRTELDCYFSTYVRPYREEQLPGLVVFNEVTALAFGLEGSRGTVGRALVATRAATLPGQMTNQPLGALGEGIGSVGAAYAAPLGWYVGHHPDALARATADDVLVAAAGGLQVPASFVFLALTDTYVRTFVETFSWLARRYHVAVVAGAVLPVLTSAASCGANGYAGWVACPGWRSTANAIAVAALADRDLASQYRSGRLRTVYEAVTPTVSNAAFVFGPDGRLTDVQPKVNLTPTEVELGWRPAPMSTVHAIALPAGRGRPVPRVRLGIAISLDAFEHAGSPNPCTDPRAYIPCLAAQQVNVLLQPEYNDGTAECASWSDFSTACGPPAWQPLSWMLSSWYAVGARDPSGHPIYPSIRYAVNPFMVGNLYDLAGDGQSAIFARDDPRARADFYAGDSDSRLYARPGPYTPYGDPPAPDPESAPADRVSLAQLDGPQPGFLALAPWALPSSGASAVLVRDRAGLAAGSKGSLESCTDGLVPGSGVLAGPCAENAEQATALVADLRLLSRVP